MSDTIEFYLEKSMRPFLTVKSSFLPSGGDVINAQGRTYEVTGRSFTIDRPGEPDQRIRCNIIVIETT